MKKEPAWRLDWNEGLSTYIPEIDEEHKNFIRLINELNQAITARMSREKIQSSMQAILDDAATHFAHEEKLLKEWEYPGAEQHAKIHVQMMRTLHDITASFASNITDYNLIEAGLKVKQALIEHLLTEDMKYRDCGDR
jgi:hemerythrin-like metal-binding protein